MYWVQVITHKFHFSFFLFLLNMEFKNKNDYIVKSYFKGEQTLKLDFAHNIYYTSQWLDKHQIQWEYLLVIVRRTNVILCYYKRGDYIHAKPKWNMRGRIKPEWI